MATKMNTPEKVHSCLEYIDNRLESTSEQTIQIAEMIINDIKQTDRQLPIGDQKQRPTLSRGHGA